MPSDELDVGTGCTVTLAGTGLSARQLEDFTPPAAVVDLLPASHQGSTIALDFIPADLADYGEFAGVLHHWQDYDYFADLKTKASTTVTLPSGATLVFTGLFYKYEPQSVTLNDRLLADFAIRVCSDVTVTAA